MRCRRTRHELVLALALVSLAEPLAARAAPEIPPSVAATIEQVTSQPKYAHSNWGFRVLDLMTGEELVDSAGSRMFIPGSIMKVYSTSTALEAYGPDYRFRTPVYRTGRVVRDLLVGNLVLVASGDFSFGLRDQPDGTLAYNNFPEIDHNYADTGAPGPTLLPNSHPLAALDELAAQVRATGIRRVRGNVVIDDRLFDTYHDWPDGVIAPIWVNENVIDITTTPTSIGKRASVDWRPKTAAIRVRAKVATVAGDAKPLTLASPRPGIVRIRGEIAADSPPILRISPIPDPAAFARTAFIEALGRAGIRVHAGTKGANPRRLLPDSTSFPASEKIAAHVSPPLSEFVKVILKVSLQPGR